MLIAISLAFGKGQSFILELAKRTETFKKKLCGLCWSEKIGEWIMRTRIRAKLNVRV